MQESDIIPHAKLVEVTSGKAWAANIRSVVNNDTKEIVQLLRHAANDRAKSEVVDRALLEQAIKRLNILNNYVSVE